VSILRWGQREDTLGTAWGPGLGPVFGAGAVRGHEAKHVGEPRRGAGIVSEGRWARHGLTEPVQGLVDGPPHECAVLFDHGCAVIPSRACQNQWHAHRYPHFLPDP
jgi:hypothetical protein